MPVWDYYCAYCKQTVERLLPSYQQSLHVPCVKCGTEMEKLPAAGGFVVTGYNAKNLYSKKT